jgi:hypothetical protein
MIYGYMKKSNEEDSNGYFDTQNTRLKNIIRYTISMLMNILKTFVLVDCY